MYSTNWPNSAIKCADPYSRSAPYCGKIQWCSYKLRFAILIFTFIYALSYSPYNYIDTGCHNEYDYTISNHKKSRSKINPFSMLAISVTIVKTSGGTKASDLFIIVAFPLNFIYGIPFSRL